MRLKKKNYGEFLVWYRPNTSDEKVLREVIESRCYRRASIDFDVKEGEHWLDLGANIGAFAIYCALRGASTECYEPEPVCYSILKKNTREIDSVCYNKSVSVSKKSKCEFWISSLDGNNYRGTLLSNKGRLEQTDSISNLYAGKIQHKQFDGIKMDIEGSEFGLIDNWLLPDCNKLCFEYHTSRDDSMENLIRRIEILKSKFRVVNYVPELDRMMEMGGHQKAFHDRVIYCMEPVPQNRCENAPKTRPASKAE